MIQSEMGVTGKVASRPKSSIPIPTPIRTGYATSLRGDEISATS